MTHCQKTVKVTECSGTLNNNLNNTWHHFCTRKENAICIVDIIQSCFKTIRNEVILKLRFFFIRNSIYFVFQYKENILDLIVLSSKK